MAGYGSSTLRPIYLYCCYPCPHNHTPFFPTGWCTYYTCLKRLSTFFSIVAEGTDYCLWMTGSEPQNMRFHLLNADSDDAISLCIWYKNTQRKDIYKVCLSTCLSASLPVCLSVCLCLSLLDMTVYVLVAEGSYT